MTQALPNLTSGMPYATGVDAFVYPIFITANRVPTSNDIQNPGTRWMYDSGASRVIYETTGAGDWDLGGNNLATTSSAGIVFLSTLAELQAGTAASSEYVPSANDVYTFVTATAIAGAPISTESVFGIVELAADSEAVAGTANNPGVTALVVQPSNLAAVFAAPPAIGGTTPAAAEFTTLAFTTLAGSAGGNWLSGGTAINIGTDASNDNIGVGTAGTRTVTIGSQTSTSSTVIDSGTGALNIGTAIAKTITLGNVTGATAVAINSGTGGLALVSTGTGDITLVSGDTLLLDCAGVLELNSSAGVIGIGNDAVSQNINVGTAGTRLITIGNVTASTSVAINVGTNGLAIDGVATSPYAIGASTTSGTITIGGTAQTGAMTFGSSSGSYITNIAASTGAGVATLNLATGVSGNTVNMATGVNTSAQVVNISTGASAADSTVNVLTGVGTAGAAALNMANNTRVTTITLGNIAPAAARTSTILGGDSAQNDTLNVMSGAPSANTSTVSVLNGAASGTATQTFNLLSGASNATAMNCNIMNGNAAGGTLALNIVGDAAATTAVAIKLATGAAAHSLAIGSASAGAISVDTAAGISLDSATASNFTVTGTADLTLQSTAGSAILLSGEAAADAVRIFASDAAGGIDVDCGSGGFLVDAAAGAISLDSALASNFTVTGAADLTVQSTAGALNLISGEANADSVNMTSAGGMNIVATGAAAKDVILTCTSGSMTLTAGESVSDAMNITASGAAGAINLSAGTGGVTFDSGMVVNVTSVAAAASPYAVLGSDYFISTDTTGGVLSLTLPAAPATGRVLVVYDGVGQAAANNVTINGNGKSIAFAGASAGSQVLNTAYESATLVYNGTLWLARNAV